jgi:hypothetical protein
MRLRTRPTGTRNRVLARGRPSLSFAFAFLMLVTSAATAAGPPVHSVTGTGIATEGALTFSTTAAVHKDNNGAVWGSVVSVIDLSAFGLGHVTLTQTPTCLSVSGNSAWIGAVVTYSTAPELIPSGTTTITLVRDLGDAGGDVMHTETAEFFAPGTVCTDQPAVPETVISSGNFQVR